LQLAIFVVVIINIKKTTEGNGVEDKQNIDLKAVVPVKEDRQTHLERNLDNNIFLSSQTKLKSCVFEIPIELDDGTQLTRYVVVGKADPFEGQKVSNFDPKKLDCSQGAGVLTTSHLKMVAALIADWEDRGKPQKTVTSFSAYFLLTRYFNYHYEDIGEAVYKLHRKLLTELKSIPIWFIDCYDSVNGNGDSKRHTYNMNILSEFELLEKFNKNGQKCMAISQYKLDGRTLQNLLAGHTRPILLKPLIRKKGDAAILLYRFCNVVLAESDEFQITTLELFRNLQITGKSYEARADRKRLLLRAINENEGELIIDGRLHFKLQETPDRKDYRLTIKKKPAPKISEDQAQSISPDLLPDETKGLPEDKVPYYHFLKDRGISYAYKLISESPHSAEVLELINQEWLDKQKNGFVFDKHPKAWLVGAYRNQDFQPSESTRTERLQEREKTNQAKLIYEKEGELRRLKDQLQSESDFLQLEPDQQLQVVYREQKGAYYMEHQRWPDKNLEEWTRFEEMCNILLPNIVAERSELANNGLPQQINELTKQLLEHQENQKENKKGG